MCYTLDDLVHFRRTGLRENLKFVILIKGDRYELFSLSCPEIQSK
jgi:hypothetical protein